MDMFELSRLMGHASYTSTDRVYARLRRKDYCKQRAAFSANMQAGRVEPVPLRALGANRR